MALFPNGTCPIFPNYRVNNRTRTKVQLDTYPVYSDINCSVHEISPRDSRGSIPLWCPVLKAEICFPGCWRSAAFRSCAPARWRLHLWKGLSAFRADSREVMNIRQASQYLGVSPDTLYKYVYEEKIPAFKLGNRWRFKKSKLDQWMEEKSTMRETRDKKKPRAARVAAGN